MDIEVAIPAGAGKIRCLIAFKDRRIIDQPGNGGTGQTAGPRDQAATSASTNRSACSAKAFAPAARSREAADSAWAIEVLA